MTAKRAPRAAIEAAVTEGVENFHASIGPGTTVSVELLVWSIMRSLNKVLELQEPEVDATLDELTATAQRLGLYK